MVLLAYLVLPVLNSVDFCESDLTSLTSALYVSLLLPEYPHCRDLPHRWLLGLRFAFAGSYFVLTNSTLPLFSPDSKNEDLLVFWTPSPNVPYPEARGCLMLLGISSSALKKEDVDLSKKIDDVKMSTLHFPFQ